MPCVRPLRPQLFLHHFAARMPLSTCRYGSVANPSPLLPRPDGAENKAHHNSGSGNGFNNPWPSFDDPGGFTIGRKILGRMITGKTKHPDVTPPTVPIVKPHFRQDRGGVKTDTLRITWLGHACVLAEFPSGFRVLFDPVFTPRCSPLPFLGPKRYTEQPCGIEDIPIIDAVVISHNHYDHLSHPTIVKIAERHPNAHFFVPLGLKDWFHKCKISDVTELDWWEARSFSLSSRRSTIAGNQSKTENEARSDVDIEATLSCLPSQHQSARSGFDRCNTLWSSWGVSSGDKSLWFGGDTGYRSVPESAEGKDDYSSAYQHLPHCPAFEQIGRLRGPFDVALIPIGAYEPRFIMSPIHSNPEDAANIFRDVRAKAALGIHWGTWVLTEEEVLEPPRALGRALKKLGLDNDSFGVCDIGESTEY